MGLIKAAAGAIGGALADQWLDAFEAGDMGDTTVMTRGRRLRAGDRRSSNTKGTENLISNGSVIQVYDNQFMLLVDGGKIVDYSAEPGYYRVDNKAMPSLFNGQFGDSLKDAFNRFKFGGTPSGSQKVYFINLKEIKGIKFGTPNPVNYFDAFYNAELFLRAFGTYSIKIMDPVKFYAEVLSYAKDTVDINDINEQYLSEFLTALSTAMNKMSVDGIRISYVQSKGQELAQYMSTILDEEWNQHRGMVIQAVGISSITYDEESKKLLAIRSQGAMLQDASVREGYVQGATARGIEAAGSNAGGAMAGFMGVGMGMGQGGGFMGSVSQSNQQQIQRDAAQAQQNTPPAQVAGGQGWRCVCGAVNQGKFCETCGHQKTSPDGEWVCACGCVNAGKFCKDCGQPKPAPRHYKCARCGYAPDANAVPRFCPECGDPFDEKDLLE